MLHSKACNVCPGASDPRNGEEWEYTVSPYLNLGGSESGFLVKTQALLKSELTRHKNSSSLVRRSTDKNQMIFRLSSWFSESSSQLNTYAQGNLHHTYTYETKTQRDVRLSLGNRLSCCFGESFCMSTFANGTTNRGVGRIFSEGQ